MGTTSRGYTYPDSTGHTRLWEHFQTLAQNVNDDIDATIIPVITNSAKQTPAATGVTTEVDILSNPWTPPLVACYRFRMKMPFDVSSGTAEAKAQLYVNGVVIDYDIRPGPGSGLIGYLRCDETLDVVSLSTITVKGTIQRSSGTGTLNCRTNDARIEIYLAGDAGVRA